MVILGIDPGTARMGWGVITIVGAKTTALSYGCILTEKELTPQKRLHTLYNDLLTIIGKTKPEYIAVEELFFATNAKTVIPVAQARGIVLLAAEEMNLPVISYSPLAVKSTITGFGKAEKSQVQRMVVELLKLTSAPLLDDTADALAIALTHAYSYKWKEKAT